MINNLRYLKWKLAGHLKPSYTAAGEDKLLEYLFASVGIKTPLYLDIGANHPVSGNNTFLFYRAGGSGVCVEADPELATQLAQYRPRDKCLNQAVDVSGASSVNVYIFRPSGLNTVSREEAEARQASGRYKCTAVITVPARSINQIISENFERCPDLLSLDIEGLDEQVLLTLDYDIHPIPVICVETVAYSESHVRPKNYGLISMLEAKGYFLYADTYVNSIMVRRDWYERQNPAKLF